MIDPQLLSQLTPLMEEKFQILTQIQVVTDPLPSASFEELVAGMKKRDPLFDSLKRVDASIHELTKDCPELTKILSNQATHEEVTEDLKPLWQLEMNIMSIVNRLLRNEESLRLNMETLQEEARKGIEKQNTSSAALASKYGAATETGRGYAPRQSKQRFI